MIRLLETCELYNTIFTYLNVTTMYLQVSLFILFVRISATTQEHGDLRYIVQRDDLKASLRQILSEDESFVRSFVGELLQDARVTSVKDAEDIKSMKQ